MVLYQWWPLTNGPGILAWTLWPTMTICWWTLYICTHGYTCVQQTWSLGQHHGIIFCKQINKMMIRWHLKVLVVKCDKILMIYRIPKSLRLMELYGWLMTEFIIHVINSPFYVHLENLDLKYAECFVLFIGPISDSLSNSFHCHILNRENTINLLVIKSYFLIRFWHITCNHMF